MGQTLHVQFSESAIRAAAGGDARLLRDDRFPALRLRFLADRRRATWETLADGRWRAGGSWPAITSAAMTTALGDLQERRASGGQQVADDGQMESVGQLLDWWLARQVNAADISERRKVSIRSAVAKWIRPALFALPVSRLSRTLVDARLIQPMRVECRPATIAKAYRMLMAAIHAAQQVGLIVRNPLEGVKFPDYGLGQLKPREARLMPKDAQGVAGLLIATFDGAPRDAMLVFLMLLLGLRVGETRQLRWAWFDLGAKGLVIPGALTKTRTQLETPLSPQLVALLERYQQTQQSRPSVYLFPGGMGQPLSETMAASIIRRFSGGAWSSHDLRKMARAGWAELGVDYLVAEMLLNHALPGLAATYVQSNLGQLKREALELWHGPGNDRAPGLGLVVDGDCLVHQVAASGVQTSMTGRAAPRSSWPGRA